MDGQEFGLQSVLENMQTCQTIIDQHGGIKRSHVVQKFEQSHSDLDSDTEDQSFDDTEDEDSYFVEDSETFEDESNAFLDRNDDCIMSKR